MKKEIFVCNCGSSSLKADVFEFNASGQENYLLSAVAERLNSDDSTVSISLKDAEKESFSPGKLNHTGAVKFIADILEKKNIFTKESRFAVGHRIVHGAHYIDEPVLLDDKIINTIEECVSFAPLHNPANLEGIKACGEIFALPQVGVFDTAFHHNMPDYASTYAIPHEITKKYHIRRYGFHGTSHEYVARRAAEILNKPFNQCRLISFHLGNGGSVAAIKDGQSIDTSMGFTPLEGLVMGTRCGDLDPALVEIIGEKENLSLAQVDTLLNKKSGLLGMCGSNDMRDIRQKIADGDDKARLARDVFVHRVRKYLGAYLVGLNGADAIIFTGGIGEHGVDIRKLSLANLDALGIIFDAEKNKDCKEGEITADNSKIKALVIPTDEELMIAKKTYKIINA